MDPRDKALQAMTPTVMVPRFGKLVPLTTPGHRFLACQNGLWLDLFRPWLKLTWPIAAVAVPMPYGKVSTTLEFLCGALPMPLIRQFVLYARMQAPNECAAWIVWSQSNGFRLVHLEETSVGPEHVEFIRPRLEDGEHLVADIHSHGYLSAFFSLTDDHDDAGEVKIAIVFGNLDRAQPTVQVRMCALGMYQKLPGGNLGIEEEEEVEHGLD